MSNKLVFHILPFDPRTVLDSKLQLPIDLDDFARQLQDTWPTGEVHINRSDVGTNIRFYISTQEQGPWVVAAFTEYPSQLQVSGWPKRIAKEIIFWYRHYIPINHPLFLLIPESGYVTELTAYTTLDDIEHMYPFPIPDDEN